MDFCKEEYFSQLERLVNIDSGFGCADGVNEIADFFERQFGTLGLHVHRHPGWGSFGDLLVITNSDAPHYDLLFLGHTDTAFERGAAKRRPFHADGVNAYGPGIADMKAGTLSIYHILKNVDPALLKQLSICVIINGDEEAFAQLSEPIMIEHASRADQVLVMEAAFPDGSHCVRRKGRLCYTVEFTGISAHAGYIFETRSASAILEMSSWIQAITALSSREKGTSVNVGLASGGTAQNMVPGRASIQFEFRMWDPSEQKRLQNAVEALLEHPFVDGVTARVLECHSALPMEPSPATESYLLRAQRTAEKLGMEFATRPRGGLSDASHVCMHTPVCIDSMGPRGELDTGNDYLESIVIDSVEESVRLTMALMGEIAEHKRDIGAPFDLIGAPH